MSAAEQMRGARKDMGSADPNADADQLIILEHEPIESVSSEQPEELLGPLVVREVSTLVSASGGKGKTTLLMQLLIEASLGLPIWGHAAFRPARPLRCLYVNAEDGRRARNYWLGRLLRAYEIDPAVVPFSSLLTREQTSRPWRMTPANLTRLCHAVRAKEYDVVALDPVVALMPSAICTGNNLEIRDFLERTCGELHTVGAAVLLSIHDSKAGLIASGGADFTNFPRVALQLTRATVTAPAGHDALVLETYKANQAWRYREIALHRSHTTLQSHVVSTTTWETPTSTREKISKVEAYTRLSEYFLFHVAVLPEDQRTTRKVRDMLRSHAEWPSGTRQADAFAAERIRWIDRTIRHQKAQVAAGLCEAPEEAR